MSDLLKSVLQDLINDRTEQAQVSLHQYIVGKTQQVAGLTEAKKSTEFVIVEEGHWEEPYEDGGGESYLDIYEVSNAELERFGDYENSPDALVKALQNGEVGKLTGKQAKIYAMSDDDGVRVDSTSVEMLFPSL